MTLHETFTNLSIADVEAYVTSGQEENLHLDFKRIADPRFEREDRKNLARAIAGFANSDGGLIVWGVTTARNTYDVEYATGLQAISPVSAFMAKLNQISGEAANPTVGAVQHRRIEIQGDSGLAVTYVPPSDEGPHMAKCGEDRYYRRSGDRFVKMEHFEIADMFGRRPQPKLVFNYRLARGATGGGPEGSWKEVTVFFGLRNEGRGGARAPYLALLVKNPYSVDAFGIDGNYHFGLDQLPSSDDSAWVHFGGGDGRYVYPGTTLDVAAVRVRVFDHEQRRDTVRVEFELAADGVPVEHGNIKIDGRTLVLAVRPDDDA